MTLLPNTQELPFKNSTENRPWGYYGLYADNEKCTTKILYINKNESLSMQYHFRRDQLYIVLDDGFLIDYSTKPVPQEIIEEPDELKRFLSLENFLKDNLISVIAREGDMFGFRRFVVHRATYRGNRTFGRALDIAMGENDEQDIIRIKDKYGREDIKHNGSF